MKEEIIKSLEDICKHAKEIKISENLVEYKCKLDNHYCNNPYIKDCIYEYYYKGTDKK